MRGPSFKVEGLAELDRRLIALAEDVGPKKARTPLRQAMQDALQPMAEQARATVRVDKGTLKRSIRVGGTLSRSQRKGYVKGSDIEVHMGPGALPQAIQEEFGNVHQAPHPFIRPAWENGKDALLESMKTALRARLDKAVARLAKKRAGG